MAWYDFDNSGGFNIGDIGAGLSRGANAIGGLFGGTKSISTPSFSNWTSGMGIDTSNLNSAELSGLTNSYWNLDSTNGFTRDTQGLFGSGGNFDLGGIGKSIGSGLDSLGKYKDAIGVAGGLFGAYNDYNTANKMQDYYDSIMAEQARQVAKEQQSTSNMQSGFASSGLFNPNKKKTTSNYYQV